MRKVVTGDQLAQLRNHDPFAIPAWRAPVYRTPLGFVVFVQAARLLGRLIRFLFRHPVAVLAVIVGVLLWRVLGWTGLAALAASTALVLVVWWWRFPASFTRFVGVPARGRWRAWHYRRRWGAVMTIGALPRSIKAASCCPSSGKCRQPGSPTGSRSGWSPASPRPTSPPGPRSSPPCPSRRMWTCGPCPWASVKTGCPG